MSTDKEMSTDVKPKKTRLMFLRRQKISSCESRAAPQEAEEHRGSCAGPGTARAAAAESRAAAPHGPRARGRALLHSLRRGSRAILSRVAAVIRRHSQQRGTQRHLHQGTQAVTAPRAPTAGAQSRAAAPHSPSPGPLEALGGQEAGAAIGAVLKTAEQEEKAWFSLEEDVEVEGFKELSQGEDDPEESCSGGQRPPVKPRTAWGEHKNLPSCTASGQASALPSRAPHNRPQVYTVKTVLGYLPPSPSLSPVEARRQWARAALRALLPGLQSQEGDNSEDAQASSSRDWSDYVSCNYEPRHRKPCKGAGLLALSLQARVPSAAKREDRSMKELSEETWNVFITHALWVNPRWWYAIRVEPKMQARDAGGEAGAELPSTSAALAAPRDSQPAAAALAAAPEDEEHPVRATAQAQEVAKTAGSAGPGTARAAAAESRAAAPHGPRARGRALLHSLLRGSRAILSRVAAVIRRHSQQPGTQRHLHQGTQAVTAPRAPTAGAQSRAAAPHSPSPGPLEALGGQGAGAAWEPVLPTLSI